MAMELLLASMAASIALTLPPSAWPAPPAGWSQHPGHCMGEYGCTNEHCNCAGPPTQICDATKPLCQCRGTAANSLTACFAHAIEVCNATAGCKSIAMSAKGRAGSFELFSLTNWSAVKNPDWHAYAMDSAVPPPKHPNPPHHSPSPPGSSSVPPNLHELECAVHAFAYEFGTNKVPASAAALHDALNLAECKGSLSPGLSAQVAATTARAQAQATAAASHVSAQLGSSAASVIHVATGGDDSAGTGSAAAPFKTLGRAQLAARSAPKPATVSVGAGKYYLNATLTLGSADSGVAWVVAPGGGVVLSGGVALKPVSNTLAPLSCHAAHPSIN
jgi:hypothetical protein